MINTAAAEDILEEIEEDIEIIKWNNNSFILKEKKKKKKGISKEEQSSVPRLEIDLFKVNELYEEVIKRKTISVNAIRCLEQITGFEFRNTKDFKSKMKQFLDQYYYKGDDLQEAMRYSEMETEEIAEWLGVSEDQVRKMKGNKQPLSRSVVDFILIMGKGKKKPGIKGRLKFRNKDNEKVENG